MSGGGYGASSSHTDIAWVIGLESLSTTTFPVENRLFIPSLEGSTLCVRFQVTIVHVCKTKTFRPLVQKNKLNRQKKQPKKNKITKAKQTKQKTNTMDKRILNFQCKKRKPHLVSCRRQTHWSVLWGCFQRDLTDGGKTQSEPGHLGSWAE